MRAEEIEEARRKMGEKARCVVRGLPETTRPRELRREEGRTAARRGVGPRAAETRGGAKAARMETEIVELVTEAAAAEAAGSRGEASRKVPVLVVMRAWTRMGRRG